MRVHEILEGQLRLLYNLAALAIYKTRFRIRLASPPTLPTRGSGLTPLSVKA